MTSTSGGWPEESCKSDRPTESANRVATAFKFRFKIMEIGASMSLSMTCRDQDLAFS